MIRTKNKPAPAAPWLVRYRGKNCGLVEEEIQTKQQARDRFFNVLAEKGGHFGRELEFVELVDPSGKLWFRDKFFAGLANGR